MNTSVKILFLVLVLFFSVGVYGQLNFKKGYIITGSNDTVYGKINDSGGNRNAKVCLFKELNTKKVIRYYPEDINAYRMIGDKYYVSRKISRKGKSKRIYIEVLIKGEVSLYKYWKNSHAGYYIEKNDGEMVELDNAQALYRYKTESNSGIIYSPTIAIESQAYMDTLHSLFRDADLVHDQIERTSFDDFSLTETTKAYLNEVFKGNDCINFERDLNMYRVRFGLFAGLQYRNMSLLPSVKTVYEPEEKYTIPMNSIGTFPVGGFVNIPLFRISDRLSLQLEVISGGINYEQEFTRQQNRNDTIIAIKTNTIAFPVMLKYEVDMGKISPSFSIGKETSFVYHSKAKIDVKNDLMIHPVEKGAWFAELGIDYKLATKLSIFSNVRFQSGRNLIIEKGNQRAGYNTVEKSRHFIKEYSSYYATLFVGLKF